jgi:hypothetical protein
LEGSQLTDLDQLCGIARYADSSKFSIFGEAIMALRVSTLLTRNIASISSGNGRSEYHCASSYKKLLRLGLAPQITALLRRPHRRIGLCCQAGEPGREAPGFVSKNAQAK